MPKKKIKLLKCGVILIVGCLNIFSCRQSEVKTHYDMDKLDEQSYLQDWLLLGPFPNCSNCQPESFRHDQRCTGFFMDYLQAVGGEEGCEPEAGDAVIYPDLNIERSWKFYLFKSKEIPLGDIYTPSEQIVVYAYCTIHCSREQKKILSIGSNDGVQVILNSQRIHRNHPKEGRELRRDNDFIPVTLKQGRNNLLIKVENGYGDFGFIARFLDKDSPLAEILQKNGQPILIAQGDLEAVFIDNFSYGSNHRAGYNGISELRHQLQDSTLFVPFYAGFNLEHIFNGDSLVNLFEPRRNRMSLKKISDSEVELHQPITPLSRVESWTRFKMVPPHYIDINFRCIIHSSDFFPHGFAGLFWASYINKPVDKQIYFWGREGDQNSDQWICAWSPEHGVESTHIEENDHYNLYAAADCNVTLANHYSNYRFNKMFYYGCFHQMVFAYLFATTGNQLIRFSQSPTGGGGPNPAWDFQFIIPDCKAGQEYTFTARLIYKKFISPDDIMDEYDHWQF
jgi:hypothetical protein